MRILLLTPVALILGAAPTLPEPAKMKVDFDKHVRPLLAEKCFSCHGSKVQQSGLRLDKRQNALRGGDYGPVIVQGKSAASKLILRLVSGDGGLQMPPTGALDPEQISMLRAWIDQGADFGRIEIKDEAPKPPVPPALVSLISAIRHRQPPGHLDPTLVNGRDHGGSAPLHHAAGFGTVATMKALLDAGADANAKNDRAATPIHWALGDLAKIRLLLDRGADVNAKQADGRTPLYQAASMGQPSAMIKLLLERGADPNLATANLATPLMAAAARGDVESMRLLVAAKADVHALSGTGGTALISAGASRNPAAVRFLLDHGAAVNAATKRKQTTLGAAAMYGSEPMVKLLVSKGADVNAADDRGYSPLMNAAYAETMPAGVVKLLLDRGARTDVRGEDETPAMLAAKRGDSEVARLLGVSEDVRKAGGVAAVKERPARSIPDAVERALALLEKQSHNFIRIGGCNSCHNQNLPSAAAGLARQRGLKAPNEIAKLSRPMREVSAERMMDMTVSTVNSTGFEMFDLGMNGAAKDDYTDAAARYIRVMQTPDGSWKTTGHRPPLTSDDFLTSAFALYILKHYGPDAEKEETARVQARGLAWLMKAQPTTTQERAFQLMGLVWAGADAAAIAKPAKALAASQRSDGGWNQLPTMGSDAYATGEALYALQLSGHVAVSDPVYQRGVNYLLRTQAPDGSWHVKTRSLPVQPYFESGYPYGHDQWISAAGSSWASMALTLASK